MSDKIEIDDEEAYKSAEKVSKISDFEIASDRSTSAKVGALTSYLSEEKAVGISKNLKSRSRRSLF